MSLLSAQTLTSVDCLKMKCILEPQVIRSAASLLLPQFHTCRLVLRNCNDLVHIDGNVPSVYLPGVIIDVFLYLSSLNDLGIWPGIKDAINQEFREISASNQLNFKSTREFVHIACFHWSEASDSRPAYTTTTTTTTYCRSIAEGTAVDL